MIYCKRCGATSEYKGPLCPSCNEPFVLSEREIENRISILKSAVDAKAHEVSVECYHILADQGLTDCEREYAKIVERGKFAEKNLDVAEEYYGRAAKKNDKEAAYRYSRLVGRANADAGRFWLIYSAILGFEDAYADVAEEFFSLGLFEDAHYFFYLAAQLGTSEHVVKMAERYYNGIGALRSEEYARWYMDKFALPPMYAIKLAYKLRKVQPKEPPRPELKNYDALLKSLACEAKEREYTEAFRELSKTRADRGAADAYADLAELHLSLGDEENVKEGFELLWRSGSLGYCEAYLTLSDLWLFGKYTKRDYEKALEALQLAGEGGCAEGFLRLGNIFLNGEIVEKCVREAIRYYELAKELQCEEAERKLNEIFAERERLYTEAKRAERYGTYDEAFSLAANSADMGYLPAALMLGDLYARGYGVEVNRKNAYLWYRYASEKGLSEALYPLALCYATGFGTQLDFKAAKQTFILAEKAGISEARNQIISLMKNKLRKTTDRLYSTAMRLIYMRKFGAAVDFLNTAMDVANHSKAIYTLGCFYEFGIFLPCNKELAFSLYEKAYALGFRDPRANYKLKVLKMIR